jgi:hypothetical protein
LRDTATQVDTASRVDETVRVDAPRMLLRTVIAQARRAHEEKLAKLKAVLETPQQGDLPHG